MTKKTNVEMQMTAIREKILTLNIKSDVTPCTKGMRNIILKRYRKEKLEIKLLVTPKHKPLKTSLVCTNENVIVSILFKIIFSTMV